MIDPQIALSYRPTNLGIETPVQVQAQQQQLSNLRTTGAYEQQRVENVSLQNQEAQRAQAAQAKLNQALQANTIKDPVTGAPQINYDAVVNHMNEAGYGREALAFKTNVNALKESDAKLQQIQEEIKTGHNNHAAALLNTVIDSPEGVRPQVYERSIAIAQQLWPDAVKQFPAQYTPEILPALQAMRDSATTVEQQITNKRQQQIADTSAAHEQNYGDYVKSLDKKADAEQKKADAYYDYMTGRNAAADKITNERIRHDKATEGIGETNADANVIRANKVGTGRAASTAASEREAYQDRKTLDGLNQKRSMIGDALAIADGEEYVDPNTKKIAAQEMNGTIRKELTNQIKNATNQGVRIMKKHGWSNEFTDPSGQSAYDAAPNPEQQPQAQPQPQGSKPRTIQPNQILKVDPKGRSKFQAGQTAFTPDNTPAKVLGFTPDGQVIFSKQK
jgi:hypothetical protein